MNTLFPYVLTPISNFFGGLTSDPLEEKLNQFKCGKSAGTDWTEKQFWKQQQQATAQYKKLIKRFNERTEFSEFLEDNQLRLTVLAGLERLFAVRQGFGILKTRFQFPDTNQASLQSIFGNGVFRGYFKGYLLHFSHIIMTQYNALFIQKSFSEHLLYSTIFEFVMFPLDSLKTIYYCDLKNQYNDYKSLLNQTDLGQLFKGVQYKLVYNLVFLYHLRNIYNDDYISQIVSLPLWASSYALLTLKTRAQLSHSQLTFNRDYFSFNSMVDQMKNNGGIRQLYSGLVPFLILNQFVCYQFYSLYSKSAQEKKIDHIRHEFNEKFEYKDGNQYQF